MRGTVLYGTGDIRFEDTPEPKITKPTDALIRLAATCVCGSDLWSYRGISPVNQPTPMGHEYCGIVEEAGSAVRTVKPGQFVIGSFFASDNTCPHCNFGYQSSCHQREFVGGAQAPLLRVPLAEGTLVPTPGVPAKEMIPNLLATSDVLGTGWFAADAANVRPGMTVAVVGDGAVGLLAVLSARQMGAERIIAMSRHEKRQKLALEFGATDIVTERGDEGVVRIKDLTKGLGADAVLECVGTQESMMQAIRSTRPGGYVSYVGVPHDVELKGEELFFSHVHLHGGPAPVRRFLPKLIDLVWTEKIHPGKVFELTLPLDRLRKATLRWTSAARSRTSFNPNQRHRKVSNVDTIREVDRPINPSRRDVLKTSATLVIAVLWGAGPAVTQENKMTDTKKPNPAPSVLTCDDLRAVSPALEYYTKGPLLDGLWKRPDLSPRDRSVITVSALIARIHTLEMPFHFALALDNGVKPSELSEIITHLAFYAGWANAMCAVAVAKDIFHQREIGIDQLPPAKDKLLQLNEEAETQRATQVNNNFGSVSPGHAQNTTDLLFRKISSRHTL